MSATEFRYKGKTIAIREDHPNATVSVNAREFSCHHHHGDNGLSMWMCDEAYFASPDIQELARHFADYGYMFDDPGRIIVDETGQVVRSAGRKRAAKKPSSRGGHGAGGGH